MDERQRRVRVPSLWLMWWLGLLQGEAGRAQRSKHDLQHRDNLIRLRGDKQREIDRLRGQLEDCGAALAASQAKEQALSSRKRMLEREVLLLRPGLVVMSIIIRTYNVNVHPYTQHRPGWLNTVAKDPFKQAVSQSNSWGAGIGH